MSEFRVFKVGDSIRRTGLPRTSVEVGSIHVVTYIDVVYQRVKLLGVDGNFYTRNFEWVSSPHTELDTKLSNPKEAIGAAKMNYHLVPDTLPTYACMAFTEGAYKYGAYNWRVHGVRASTYYSALNRHIKKWWNGEDVDPKTQVPHLANAMACIGIILDAQFLNKLTDDRPPKADIQRLLDESEKVCQHLRTLVAGLPDPHHCTALEPVCPASAG